LGWRRWALTSGNDVVPVISRAREDLVGGMWAIEEETGGLTLRNRWEEGGKSGKGNIGKDVQQRDRWVSFIGVHESYLVGTEKGGGGKSPLNGRGKVSHKKVSRK